MATDELRQDHSIDARDHPVAEEVELAGRVGDRSDEHLPHARLPERARSVEYTAETAEDGCRHDEPRPNRLLIRRRARAVRGIRPRRSSC
jgi:hypothetical protein